MFGYEEADDVIQNPEDEFKCNYFLVIVDGAINAITKRFDQINTFNEVFEFLYDVGKLCYVPDLEILNCFKDLEIRLSENNKKDLNGYDLYHIKTPQTNTDNVLTNNRSIHSNF